MQGVLTVSKNPRCKVGGRFDVTFADEICEVDETLVLRVAAVASMLFLTKTRDCFGDEHQRWLMHIAVPPPSLIGSKAQKAWRSDECAVDIRI